MSTVITETTEGRIRNFLTQELGKEWGLTIALEESFSLDSLDQVDLRVFLEETFSAKIEAGQKPFQSIQTIMEFLSRSLSAS